MANRTSRRRFGNIRKLPSGRYQVRYPGPDGLLCAAPRTFERKEEASRYLTLVEAELVRGEWVDPERGNIAFGEYAARWLQERPNLRPRTIELYQLLLRRHINPRLGAFPLGRLTTPLIRTWRADLLAAGASQSMAAKAYRLIRAILNTAVKEDELLRVNPCRIPGADKEHSEERPVLDVHQVFALAGAVPDRYKAFIMLSTFASLRWGEAIALTRRDINLAERTVTVTKAYSELAGSKLVIGPTKSRAGVRVVSFPGFVLAELVRHLDEYVPPKPDALVFTGAKGAPLRRSTFRTATHWAESCSVLGVPGLHFHDLRHTGNTLASRTGASTRDLMARMGHDSPRAALIYQHTNTAADRAIATAVDAAVAALLAQDDAT